MVRSLDMLLVLELLGFHQDKRIETKKVQNGGGKNLMGNLLNQNKI